jgi:hypothetical protein
MLTGVSRSVPVQVIDCQPLFSGGLRKKTAHRQIAVARSRFVIGWFLFCEIDRG